MSKSAPCGAELKVVLAITAVLIGWLLAVMVPAESHDGGALPSPVNRASAPFLTDKGDTPFCLDGTGAYGRLPEIKPLNELLFGKLFASPPTESSSAEISSVENGITAKNPRIVKSNRTAPSAANDSKDEFAASPEETAADNPVSEYETFWREHAAGKNRSNVKNADAAMNPEPADGLPEADALTANTESSHGDETEITVAEANSGDLKNGEESGELTAEAAEAEKVNGPDKKRWPKELAISDLPKTEFTPGKRPGWDDQVTIAPADVAPPIHDADSNALVENESGANSKPVDSPVLTASTNAESAKTKEPITDPSPIFDPPTIVEAKSNPSESVTAAADPKSTEKSENAKPVRYGVLIPKARAAADRDEAVRSADYRGEAPNDDAPISPVSGVEVAASDAVRQNSSAASSSTASASEREILNKPTTSRRISLPKPMSTRRLQSAVSPDAIAAELGYSMSQKNYFLEINGKKLGADGQFPSGTTLILPAK